MPVQPLSPNGPGQPAAAAAQSVQNQQQANAQRQNASVQDSQLLADAQKTQLRSRIASLDAANSKARAQEALQAQQARQTQAALFQKDAQDKSLAEASRQFNERNELNKKVLEFRQKKELFQAKSDQFNSLLESTKGLARNEDGTFKNPSVQANFDKVSKEIDDLSVDRGLEVSSNLLRFNSQAIGSTKAEGDAKLNRQLKSEFELNRLLASTQQSLKTAGGFARTTLMRVTEPDVQKAMNASLRATVQANGELTTGDYVDAFATAGGLKNNQREFLRLMSSQEPGDNQKAIQLIEGGGLSVEEALALQATLEGVADGIQGSDGLINPLKDSLGGGLESAIPDIRNNLKAIAGQIGRFTNFANVTAASSRELQMRVVAEGVRKNLGPAGAQRALKLYSDGLDNLRSPQARTKMTIEQRRQFDLSQGNAPTGTEQQVISDLSDQVKFEDQVTKPVADFLQLSTEQGGPGIFDTGFGIEPNSTQDSARPTPAGEQVQAIRSGLPANRDSGQQFTREEVAGLSGVPAKEQVRPVTTSGVKFDASALSDIEKAQLAKEGFSNQQEKTRSQLKTERNTQFDKGEGLVNGLNRGRSNLNAMVFGEQNMNSAQTTGEEFGTMAGFSDAFGGATADERAKAAGKGAKEEFLSDRQAKQLAGLLKKGNLDRKDRDQLRRLARTAQKISDAQAVKEFAKRSKLNEAFPQGSKRDRLIETILSSPRISIQQSETLQRLGGLRATQGDGKPSAKVIAAAERLGVDPNGTGSLPLGSRTPATRDAALLVQNFRQRKAVR